MKVLHLAIIILFFSCNNPQPETQTITYTNEPGNQVETVSVSSTSIIAIKKPAAISDLLNALDYRDLYRDKTFVSLDSFLKYLNENYFDKAANNISLRGFYTNSSGTLLFDPEMVDITLDSALVALSEKSKLPVFTFLTQSSSGSFGFTKYNPLLQRHFYSTDGKITENLGQPLKEEENIILDKNISQDDIFLIIKRLGFDIKEQGSVNKFVVKELASE